MLSIWPVMVTWTIRLYLNWWMRQNHKTRSIWRGKQYCIIWRSSWITHPIFVHRKYEWVECYQKWIEKIYVWRYMFLDICYRFNFGHIPRTNRWTTSDFDKLVEMWTANERRMLYFFQRILRWSKTDHRNYRQNYFGVKRYGWHWKDTEID